MEKQVVDLIGIGSPVVDLVAHVEDHFVEALEGGKGGMELVDSVTLEELVTGLLNEPRIAPGGSAGNTTFAAAMMGSRVSFIGKLGHCEAADFYRERFLSIGADITRFKLGDMPNARCLSLVTPDSERTMRTDLGAAMTLTPEEITVEDFHGARHVHMEGYLAFNRDLMEKILSCAKSAGCTTSFDLASFEVVKAAEDVLDRWLHEYIDIVFANEDEAGAFFPHHEDNYHNMVTEFAKRCDIAAVKLGGKGSLVAQGDQVESVEAVMVEKLVDTTGAGDYWAGGFLNAWLSGMPLEECGRHGSALGAEVVQVVGASLDEERWHWLRSELIRLESLG